MHICSLKKKKINSLEIGLGSVEGEGMISERCVCLAKRQCRKQEARRAYKVKRYQTYCNKIGRALWSTLKGEMCRESNCLRKKSHH